MKRPSIFIVSVAAVALLVVASLAVAQQPSLTAREYFVKSNPRSTVMVRTINVDDDAANDPGPGNPLQSDPLEDGSDAHPFDAIQEGLDASENGDIVVVHAGVYSGSGNSSLTFRGKEIVLRSASGASHTLVNGSVTFDSGEGPNSRLEGFTIDYLTSCMTNSSPTIVDSLLRGFQCLDGSPTVVNCTISNSTGRPGMYFGPGSAVVRDCIVSGNGSGQVWGGGIASVGAGSSPRFENCTITANVARGGGGVYCSEGSSPTFYNCNITENVANDWLGLGAGVACVADAAATFNQCDISRNVATGSYGRGSGVYLNAARVDITNSTIRNNSLPGVWENLGGSGICCEFGSVNLAGSVISGNSGSAGVNLRECDDAAITGCTIAKHPAFSGIALENTHARIVGCRITANGSHGILTTRAGVNDVTVLDCNVTGNRGLGIGASNGTRVARCAVSGNADSGIQVSDGAIVSNSKIVGNGTSPGYMGSGVYLQTSFGDDPVAVSNCLITGNASSWCAGGVCGSNSVDGTRVSGCTVTRNAGFTIGGGDFFGPIVGISNSIFWGNAPGQLTGTVDTTHSDIQGGWPGQGNVDADPGFVLKVGGAWTADGSYDAQTFQLLLTDATAAWDVGTLVGMVVNPDVSQPLEFTIVDNTATAMRVWADWPTNDAGQSWIAQGATYQVFDYRLSPGSSCIDAGNNAAVLSDVMDLDGDGIVGEPTPLDLDMKPRFIDNPNVPDSGAGAAPIVDMGAYEFGAINQPIPAASTWGLLALAMLMLVVGTLILRPNVTNGAGTTSTTVGGG